jgi:NTP pyrophosphatase (non-canonical NTP hydrolase)
MRTKPHPDPDCDYLELAKIGMVGELGEIAELLKKGKYSGKLLDPQDLLKEAGDLLWHMALYADVTGYVFALSPAEDCYTAPQDLFQLLRIIEALAS